MTVWFEVKNLVWRNEGFDFKVTIAAGICFYVPAFLVYVTMNKIKTFDGLSNQSNVVLVHFFQHGLIAIWNVYHILVLFSKSDQMRPVIWREAKEFCSKCWQWEIVSLVTVKRKKKGLDDEIIILTLCLVIDLKCIKLDLDHDKG